jgi:hypothetical protein
MQEADDHLQASLRQFGMGEAFAEQHRTYLQWSRLAGNRADADEVQKADDFFRARAMSV